MPLGQQAPHRREDKRDTTTLIAACFCRKWLFETVLMTNDLFCIVLVVMHPCLVAVAYLITNLMSKSRSEKLEKLVKQYSKAQQSTNSLTNPNTAWHRFVRHVYSSHVALRIQINTARIVYSAHVALLIWISGEFLSSVNYNSARFALRIWTSRKVTLLSCCTCTVLGRCKPVARARHSPLRYYTSSVRLQAYCTRPTV